MAKTTGFIECFDVYRVIRITIKLEQRLIDALHKADNVFFFVRFFKYPNADTAKLGTALHQGLITE